MADSESSSGSVRVTLKDVFNKVDDVGRDVSEMKGSVATIRQVTQENTKDIQDHEHRIRTLEAWRYALPASAVLGLLGVVGSVVAVVMGK